MKRWLLACICALVSGFAMATPAAADNQVEASMLVTGSIVIAPDGSVRSHALDHPEKLSPTIRAFIDKAVSAWKFVPVVVDGKPVAARTQMHLRLIADATEHGNYAVRVGGASFTGGAPGEHADKNTDHHMAPRYPPAAIRARVGANVYLVLKIGRQGQVLDAAAEQVNLTARGSVRQMKELRGLFAKASLAAAKRWTYDAAAHDFRAGEAYWVARVPVVFRLSTMGAVPVDPYGQWQPYVRGPQEIVPWLDPAQLAAGSADTTPDGSVMPVGQGPQLASPASGG